MGAQGIATINFGATPVSEASVPVTSQTGFLAASSQAEAWFQEGSTGDNNTTLHRSLAFLAKTYCDTFLDGVGFTIRVTIPEGCASGQFKIPWGWN
jgi:hypothetical protein